MTEPSSKRNADIVVIDSHNNTWQCRLLRRVGLAPQDGGRRAYMACADLDHLVYLPAGDTALTRRAAAQRTQRRGREIQPGAPPLRTPRRTGRGGRTGARRGGVPGRRRCPQGVPLHELSRVPPTQLTGRSSLLLGRQRRPFADVQRAQSHRPPRSLVQAVEGSWSFARASLIHGWGACIHAVIAFSPPHLTSVVTQR